MRLLAVIDECVRIDVFRRFGAMMGVYSLCLGVPKITTFYSHVGKIIELFAGIHKQANHMANFL